MRMFGLRTVSLEDLLVFHTKDYVNFIANPQQDLEQEFGFGYDCPLIEDLECFVKTLAAGSLTAADLLVERRVRVAINWSGGWHHAKRDAAAGFCYVNDVVLAIHRLQAAFKRVMYVDLDVHHGDGVEDAFSSTDKVMTLSIHKMEPGFFPGTGACADTGFGKGKFYSVNVPLQEGVDDDMFKDVFNSLLPLAIQAFKPDVFVVQCGADGLAGDPLGGFNLTPKSLAQAVVKVVDVGLPVLLLGGGGYNIANSVRCWLQVTADLVGSTVPEDIPDEDPFFLQYGPDFVTQVSPGPIKNSNSPEYVAALLKSIKDNLKNLDLTIV